MDFFCLQRQGEDYHSQDFTAEFASASALRHGIFTMTASDPWAASDYDAILSQIPEANWQQVSALVSQHAFVHPDDLSALLHYQLITDRDFTKYFDCSQDLANKINNCKFDFTTYTDFCGTLKSKNLTHARISRVLCHMLLHITNEFMETALACETMPYLRILGFRKDAGELLTRISNAGSAPMVTSPADAAKVLSPAGLSLLEKDMEAAHIYRSLQIEHGDKKTVGQNYPTEFTRKLLVVE
jgi:predicted nucleotidyltransferase